MAYISRLEIGNVVLQPARLEVGHYDMPPLVKFVRVRMDWFKDMSCCVFG